MTVDATIDLLDASILRGLVDLGGDDDPQFLNNLVKMFYSRVPKILEEIEEAIKQKDAKKLERAAHSLKGSCANIGAMRMMKSCELLERLGRAGKTDGTQGLIKDIQTIYVDVKAELNQNWVPTLAAG